MAAQVLEALAGLNGEQLQHLLLLAQMLQSGSTELNAFVGKAKAKKQSSTPTSPAVAGPARRLTRCPEGIVQQRGLSDERVTHFQSFHDALRKGHRLDELGVTRRTLQIFSARFAFALFGCLSRICGAFGGLTREKNESCGTEKRLSTYAFMCYYALVCTDSFVMGFSRASFFIARPRSAFSMAGTKVLKIASSFRRRMYVTLSIVSVFHRGSPTTSVCPRST